MEMLCLYAKNKGFLPEFSICIFKSSSVASEQQEREGSYKGKRRERERVRERERGFNPELTEIKNR